MPSIVVVAPSDVGGVGGDTVQTEDAAEGVRLVRRLHPSAVLLADALPGQVPLQFVRRLRSASPGAAIIVLATAGSIPPGATMRAFAEGAFAIVPMRDEAAIRLALRMAGERDGQLAVA